MNDDTAIKVENVSKTFKLPHSKNDSIKSKLISLKDRQRGYEIQQALNEISFEVKKGDFFGIVGRNGSGKSTLLKLISGIYTPDSGDIQVNGKLTPFIELGVGFNPELSGRDNVFLNGSLLGFSRKEMEGMYDEIVAFAELERFMDQKLKNYSSGMQVRLAFSIAIQANSDILVLDEVLAVGDEAFQRKCYDYFEQLKARKQTVILVTHDMRTVEQFCTKALLIRDGRIDQIGNPSEVAAEYTKMNQEQIKIQGHKRHVAVKKSDITSTKIKVLDNNDNETSNFNIGDSLRVVVKWDIDDVENVGIAIHKQSGEKMFSTNTFATSLQGKILKDKEVNYEVDLMLAPGTYYMRVRLLGDSPHKTVELINEGPLFDIFAIDSLDRTDGLIRLPYKWR